MDIEPCITESTRIEDYKIKDVVTIEDVGPCSSSDEVEERYAARESTTLEDGNVDPYIGMEFDSEQATYSFYNEYAERLGFGIRKRFIRRSRMNNEVIGRTYVCSREGLKRTRVETDNPRPNTRLDCKAMMKVKRIGNGKWVTIKLVKEHNHELNPLIQSQKNRSKLENNVTRSLKVSKIMSTAGKQADGVRNSYNMDKDARSFVDKEQRDFLSPRDAQTICEYFVHAQVANPGFFYAMELDEEQRLRNVFWVDTKSKMAYAHFGDVVTFDTTFLTNNYDMRLVSFVGVNHHGQYVLFGCALVTDATKASFLWVFRTWLTAMLGVHPKAIITDQDKAIKVAVAEAFPETRHRICLWHIMRRVHVILGNLYKANANFVYKFDKCMYDSVTADEFERRWNKLIDAYELTNHEWLQMLFQDRAQWVPVYLKDTFFAGMSISQRGESVKSFFDDHVNRKTSLKEFVDQYDLNLQKKCGDEERADCETYHKIPHLKTGSPYEAQMASIYTLEIFKKFQDEILQIPSCTAVHINIQQEGTNSVYVVKELVMKPNGKRGTREYTVMWNASETQISCICRLFEFKGYLCRHAMVVLFAVSMYEIPSRYILKRWTRHAKSMEVSDADHTSAQDGGFKFIAKCFSDLCADSIKLVEEGSLSKERYKAAKWFLKEALVKVTSMELQVVPITMSKKEL